MVLRCCAWCGKQYPKEWRHIHKRQTGPWYIYFYQCPRCYHYTGIDYKLEVRSKMNRSDIYG